jgi:adenine phosphoribosyltransferase
MNMDNSFDLDSAIRKIQDFPKKGILFYDITSILTNPKAFAYCIDKMDELYSDKKIDGIAAIEARGFVFASPYALKKGLPLLLLRKKGKLPGEKLSKKFKLEYGEDEIQVHKEDIIQGGNYLLVDDLIATGGTLQAARDLLEEGGANIIGIFGVIGLPFLDFKSALEGTTVTTLIDYHCE